MQKPWNTITQFFKLVVFQMWSLGPVNCGNITQIIRKTGVCELQRLWIYG